MTNDLTPRLADMPTEVLESAAKAMAEDYGDRWDDTDRDSWRSQTRAAYPIIARWVAAQAQAKALNDAADEVHREARWQLEAQWMAEGGYRSAPDPVGRLRMVERILRRRADEAEVVGRG